MQVTSSVKDAQRFAQQFANNNLNGNGLLQDYRTGKTRICVTVGMMTTGYDCPDLLNLGMFRPIFSPTEFIQIKGRGTRRHNFSDNARGWLAEAHSDAEKATFKLFDFFGNFEVLRQGSRLRRAGCACQMRSQIRTPVKSSNDSRITSGAATINSKRARRASSVRRE